MLSSFNYNLLIFNVISIELEFVQKVPEKIICKKMVTIQRIQNGRIGVNLMVSSLWITHSHPEGVK